MTCSIIRVMKLQLSHLTVGCFCTEYKIVNMGSEIMFAMILQEEGVELVAATVVVSCRRRLLRSHQLLS